MRDSLFVVALDSALAHKFSESPVAAFVGDRYTPFSLRREVQGELAAEPKGLREVFVLVSKDFGEYDFEGSVFHPIEEVAVVANLYSFFHNCKITACFGKKVGEMKSFSRIRLNF